MFRISHCENYKSVQTALVFGRTEDIVTETSEMPQATNSVGGGTSVCHTNGKKKKTLERRAFLYKHCQEEKAYHVWA